MKILIKIWRMAPPGLDPPAFSDTIENVSELLPSLEVTL